MQLPICRWDVVLYVQCEGSRISNEGIAFFRVWWACCHDSAATMASGNGGGRTIFRDLLIRPLYIVGSQKSHVMVDGEMYIPSHVILRAIYFCRLVLLQSLLMLGYLLCLWPSGSAASRPVYARRRLPPFLYFKSFSFLYCGKILGKGCTKLKILRNDLSHLYIIIQFFYIELFLSCISYIIMSIIYVDGVFIYHDGPP